MTMDNSFVTPVLLNTFNRPDETFKVLQALKERKVPVLYIHSDGPRLNNNEDVENIQKVRQLIDSTIDWNCEVYKLYENTNLGCGLGPCKAITWFFQNVEEGIILEDDCLPHPDFFMYCQELLERYRHNDQIYVIGGTNRHPSKITKRYSYHFSPYMEIWGWATWKRVWKMYDFNFSKEEEDFKKHIKPFLYSNYATKYWTNILRQSNEDGETKTYWDFQLEMMSLYNNKLNIIPNHNLVENIGFNSRATHTIVNTDAVVGKPTFPILPLSHSCTIKSYNCIRSLEYNPNWRNLKRFIKRIFRYHP